MPIEGIIFDFGGVIMRTEDRQPRMKLAQRLGVSVEALEKLVFASSSAKKAEMGYIGAHQHWQTIAKILQAPEEEIPAIRQQFFAGDRMDWALLENIQSQRKKYRTALLSNAFDDLRMELTGELPAASAYHISKTDQFLDFFDEVIISAEVGFAKPDRRIYQYAADRLHVPIEKCVFIDDFSLNIEGAHRAGMKAIHFLNLEQVHRDLDTILSHNHSK
ncbi:MAG: HAD family phosphatase [Anaerolineales bacterium]|nr:HAD family phosphatase [Anaerolineales bacterium]